MEQVATHLWSIAAKSIFSHLGLRVDINRPYAGGFITQHYGRPIKGPARTPNRNRSLTLYE